MKNIEWKLLNNTKPKTHDDLLAILLQNRLSSNITTNEFLNPKHPKDYIKDNKNFQQVLANARRASELILHAIKNKQKIVVYGDYDVDGVTSTAIIWRTIYNELGYKNIEPFIPNRFEDGYGLSIRAVETLHETGCQLLLTVDCGIVSTKEVLHAKKLGMTVIISDHHEPETKLPNADAIVHTTDATGAGIAWIIATTLLEKNKIDNASYLLGLASMGTIADLQPLLGFNRSVVYHGLKELNDNPTIGIKKLKIEAGIENQELDTYHIGWQIGPRLNATGRLNDAINSLRLLCTNSEKQAISLAKSINTTNQQRQSQTQNGYNIAQSKIDDQNIPPIIITSSTNYHDGIIGLIAGRLTQKYNRPSIAIAIDKKNNTAKGSVRSTKDVNIIEVLRRHKKLFLSLGGHTMAAGFSIIPENIQILQKKLLQDLQDTVFIREIRIDTALPINLISRETVNLINKLKPFGVGNQSPTFMSSNFTIYNIQTFGKENDHIKLYLMKENQRIVAVGFGQSHMEQYISINDKVDIAYQMVTNNWNNTETVELRIKDIKTKDQ